MTAKLDACLAEENKSMLIIYLTTSLKAHYDMNNDLIILLGSNYVMSAKDGDSGPFA